MNYFVIFLAIISIILVLLSKFSGLSIVYPSLMIVLTIILDIVANTVKANKDKKENTNIDDVLNKK